MEFVSIQKSSFKKTGVGIICIILLAWFWVVIENEYIIPSLKSNYNCDKLSSDINNSFADLHPIASYMYDEVLGCDQDG